MHPPGSGFRILERFYAPIWEMTGIPTRTILDIGCGLDPLTLPWMGLAPEATYHASEVDRRPLDVVDAFLDLVGQPHAVHARDLVADGPPPIRSDVALLLKLVPMLDRQVHLRPRGCSRLSVSGTWSSRSQPLARRPTSWHGADLPEAT